MAEVIGMVQASNGHSNGDASKGTGGVDAVGGLDQSQPSI